MRPQRPTRAEMRDRMDALGVAIAKKRDEAIQARKESGIEDIWAACEEAYLGIDDANRHEFAGAKWAKATDVQGPLTTNDMHHDSTRSTAFVRLTSRYVDFGAAKLSEIALPIDDKAFAFEPTPIPELVQPIPPQQGMEQQASMMAQGMTQAADIDALVKQAKEAADKAEQRIYDWMVECRHTAEMRKVTHDAARIGVGILKGPIPDMRKVQAVTKKDGVTALQITQKTVPVTKWTDPKNCYPAPGCGENIHDGDYFFERDYNSKKQLKKLKNRKPWISDQIEKVLREGPGKIFEDDGASHDKNTNKNRYERWHYYGALTREEMECAGLDNLPEDCTDAYAIVTLVNDSVVRCVLNPLDSGRFPYHAFAWSRRAGHWAGVGIAEQVSMPQRMVNAATRAVLENAGISAGVQIILDRGLVRPADGSWNMSRNKIWFKDADSVLDDVRKAFHIFDIPNVQAELMPIIEYALRLAEEHSSIPLVSMGQYAEGGSPQTLGQAELQNNNANTLLREKGEALDDSITEPLVMMFYEWLLVDPDVPEDEKGDFKINAHGTSAMVEKAIQEFTIIQALQMSLNPAYGADPKKAYAMWLKTKRINPEEIQFSEEELQQQAESQQQVPDPRIEAANINATARLKAAEIAASAGMQKEQMRSQVVVQRMIADTDRDVAYVQEQRARSRENAELRMRELQAKTELAMLDYANKRNITVDQIRAKLATEKAKLQTQKQLATMTATPPQVATPPTEPAGRAPDGQAYQR